MKKQPQRAYEEMEKAFALDETDARVYLELDQLKKRLNVPVKERWSDMENILTWWKAGMICIWSM